MKKSLLLLGALLASALFATAQMAGGPSLGGGAAISKFFGEHTSFSARCVTKVTDKENKELMSGEMKYAMLDGKVRLDIDMTAMKAKGMPPGSTDQLKQMGMAETVNISRTDLKAAYLIYPGLSSYVKIPLDSKQNAVADKSTKVEITKLGEEAIDGHACIKNKVVVTTESGESFQATVWNAKDLKDFPLQIQSEENGKTSLMTFKDVSEAKPDAKLFELPTGYTEYPNPQAMMMGAMSKMMKDQ